MTTKRPIDLQRDAAGQMEIGTAEEGSITDLVSLADRLLVIKQRAVYEMILADAIDPARTNPSVPNSQQRIFAVGSDDPYLGRSLLTADVMLNTTFLPAFNREEAMQAALRATTDLLTLRDELAQLSRDVDDAARGLSKAALKSGFNIPTVLDLETRGRSMVQRSDHFVVAMLDIGRVFFGKEITHADSLLDYVERNFPAGSKLRKFVAISAPFLRQIRKARNAIEHPKPAERAVFTNFTMRPDGGVEEPSFELIHPKYPVPRDGLVAYFTTVVERLSLSMESFIGFACEETAQMGKFPLSVTRVDGPQRPSPHVRLSYAIEVDGRWVPTS